MKTSSMRFRILIWNVSILAIALFGFMSLAHIAIRGSLHADMDRRLNGMAETVIRFYAEEDRDGPPPFPMPPPGMNERRREAERQPRRDMRPHRLLRAFDLHGKPLPHPGPPSATTETPWDNDAFAKGVTGKTLITIITDKEDNLQIRVLTRPLLRGGRQIGVIQTAVSYEEMQSLLNTLAKIMLILVPCVLCVAGFGGVLLTDRALGPVRHIIGTAEKLNPDDLSQRLPVVGADEFGHLAVTMNGMLARIETAFAGLRESLERERRFTSDASHELRTPLTAIIANTTLAQQDDTSLEEYQQSMSAINMAALNMRRVVEDLLLLARSDSGQLAPACAGIVVQDLFDNAVMMVAKDKPQAVIQTAIAADADTLWGDAHQLQRVLINVLENALRYTPVEGKIILSATRVADKIELSVADTGEGIAPEHLAHIGERFYRADASRARQHGGTGLGLAICRGIIEAHHGRLTIHSTPGEGTCVIVLLPGEPT